MIPAEADVPGAAVTSAFGVTALDAELLHGGDEVSIRFGEVVLKRVADVGSAA